MATNRDTRILNTMRALLAKGITDEEALINTAANVIDGSEMSQKAARKVYEAHFKIFTAN
jgi:hypothetical protein